MALKYNYKNFILRKNKKQNIYMCVCDKLQNMFKKIGVGEFF